MTKHLGIILTALMLVLFVVSGITSTGVDLLRPGLALAQGPPANPILVVVNSGSPNPFGRYVGEILGTEGFNEFQIEELGDIDALYLDNFDIVILAETPLTAPEVTMFSDWVAAGGNLIAMRPDKQLAALLGLSDAFSTLSDAYLLVDTSAGPGVGIVNETIQFHGSADLYTLSGATSLATLYSDATTATSHPAVTLRSVGANGGQAAAFTYDLARSVVYTRQGNPAWAGDERDGAGPIRANDMFYGAKSGDVQPDWIDLNKVAIPQADEQQRLLANLILDMNLDNMPLPRFWYFPRGLKAAVIMTGDDHGGSGTAGRFDIYNASSAPGCSVADWECVRSSSYVYTNNAMEDAQAAAYHAQGFEVGLHFSSGCGNWTPAWLESAYPSQLAAWRTKYPSLPDPTSERTHCIAWSDWATFAEVELANGSRLDTNYYYWPSSWILNRQGMFTGSGMPMRFADLDGTIIDVYQAVSQMTDESGQSYPSTINTLLDRAIGPEGYYGAFTANMHTDSASSAGSNAIVASAQARGVPVVSGRQMVEWLDGRNGSSFGSLSWSGNILSFSVAIGSGANGLQVMVPTQSSVGELTGITFGASPISYATETIKGVEYAVFLASAGAYECTYLVDTTAPMISDVSALPAADGTASITWTTNEESDSLVDYGTAPDTLILSASDAALVTAHEVILTGLDPETTYYYRVTSTDAATNSAIWPPIGDPAASFTTPSSAFIDTTVADFSAGSGCVVDPGIGDGALRLAATIDEDFSGSSLPAGWSSTLWSGSVTVGGGLLTLDGALARDDTFYTAGRSLEFVATFSAVANQHIGFGGGINTYNTTPWAIFSTMSGSGLYARTAGPGTDVNQFLGSDWLGEAHLFRIDWSATGVDFYIDGSPVASSSQAITEDMRVAASDYTTGGPSLPVDWIRMSPYLSPCTFESRVFDADESVDWLELTWTGDQPAGTSVSLETRTGDTPTPDGSWSAWALVSSPIASPDGRYIQYRAELEASDTSVTPVVQEVSITYNLMVNDPPVATFTYGCTGLSCDFDASGSYDPDGTITAYAWDLGDGNNRFGVTVSHPYTTAGTYTVLLTVTDDDGATDTDSQDITVSEAAPTMHVASITITLRQKGRKWEATAVVKVVDENGSPLRQATVTGDWDMNGTVFNSAATGSTKRRGEARVVSGKTQANSGDLFTFSVTSASHPDYAYDPAANLETSDSATVP